MPKTVFKVNNTFSCVYTNLNGLVTSRIENVRPKLYTFKYLLYDCLRGDDISLKN